MFSTRYSLQYSPLTSRSLTTPHDHIFYFHMLHPKGWESLIQDPKPSININHRCHNSPQPAHTLKHLVSTCLHIDTPSQPQCGKEHMPKSAMKTITPQKLAPFQDYHTQTLIPLPDCHKKLTPFQGHPTPNLSPSQDHHTTANAHDIIILKKAFPASLVL